MKCTINFSAGMILGVIGQAMFKYSVFLYYSVFCVQVVIIFILINYLLLNNKDVKK